MPTTVRAHPRKGTRGVRRHLRFIETYPPLYVRLMRPTGKDTWAVRGLDREGHDVRSVNAYVDYRNPHEIVIAYPKHHARSPEAWQRILPHETLHAALARLGEHQAFLSLDARYTPQRSHGFSARKQLTREGLYKYRPKKEK